MLVHHLHVRCNIAGRPQAEKNAEGCRVNAIYRFKLRWHTISRGLNPESHIQIRSANRQITLLAKRISLHSSEPSFSDVQSSRLFADEQGSIAVDILNPRPHPIASQEIQGRFCSISV